MSDTKDCTLCLQELPRSEFGPSNFSKTGLRSECRPCRKAAYAARTAAYRLTLTEQRCPLCKEVKPLDAFGVKASAKSGRNPWCLPCARERANQTFTKNRAELRWRRLERKFGITRADYEQMRVQQNDACLVCEKPAVGLSRKLAVDHCHSTGAVRGLLCATCNTGIGQVGDSLDAILRAVVYLAHFELGGNFDDWIPGVEQRLKEIAA